STAVSSFPITPTGPNSTKPSPPPARKESSSFTDKPKPSPAGSTNAAFTPPPFPPASQTAPNPNPPKRTPPRNRHEPKPVSSAAQPTALLTMKALADLYLALDQTNKTGEKVAVLAAFFRTAPSEEKIWALALLSGRRPRRQVKTGNLRTWAAECAGIPDWLFNECHDHTGDLAETIALLLPPPEGRSHRSTAEWINILNDLKGRSETEQKSIILDAWNCLSTSERLVFNKLITGAFRIGVSQT